jgi:hypothetical protein
MIDTRLRNNLIMPAAPADNQLPDILEWELPSQVPQAPGLVTPIGWSATHLVSARQYAASLATSEQSSITLWRWAGIGPSAFSKGA